MQQDMTQFAAAPYDGDALAAGREVGALLGIRWVRLWCGGRRLHPEVRYFQRQNWSIGPDLRNPLALRGLETAGECGAGNVGAIAGLFHPIQEQRVFPNDLEGVFTISNCRERGWGLSL